MRSKDYLVTLILILTDILALIVSFYSAYFIRILFFPLFLHISKGFFPLTHFYKFYMILFVFVLVFFYEKIYFKRHIFWEEFIYIFRGLLLSTILIVLFVYFARSEGKFARTIIILMFFNSIILVPFFRYITKFLLNKTFLYKKNVAIIGSSIKSKKIMDIINKIWYLGYNVVGGILPQNTDNFSSYVLGTVNKLEDIIKRYKLSTVIIVEEKLDKNKINKIISKCESILPEVKFVPDTFALKMVGVQPEYLIDTFLLSIPNNLVIPLNRFFKRVFDSLLSFILSIILIPFFIIIGILIKLDSKGPVFFIQERIGYNGKLFKFLKFRSMYVDGDKRLKEFIKKHKWAQYEWNKYQKLKSYDPRVTRVGKFLRRFSIDEMPQIFNVLIGNMSIIGPRPYLPREKNVIGKYASVIFNVKPGLTGLWQIRGRNKLSFRTRLKMDEFYVRNWSFFLDFMILAKTFKVVITGEGAY